MSIGGAEVAENLDSLAQWLTASLVSAPEA
jgi:hypothetical protein